MARTHHTLAAVAVVVALVACGAPLVLGHRWSKDVHGDAAATAAAAAAAAAVSGVECTGYATQADCVGEVTIGTLPKCGSAPAAVRYVVPPCAVAPPPRRRVWLCVCRCSVPSECHIGILDLCT